MRLTQEKGRELAGVGPGPLKVYTEEELASHNTVEDAWTAINGKVYNISPYMRFHPGGVIELMRGAGIDSTHYFDEFHAWVTADAFLETCQVGFLSKGLARDPEECQVMDPQVFEPFVLQSCEDVNHNCKVLRFELEDSASLPQWDLIQHVRVRSAGDNNKAQRDYTLVSPPGAKGYFEILVKRYEGGPVSERLLHSMTPGSTVEVKGPLPSLRRLDSPNVLMVAAGTGVLPMIQLLRMLGDRVQGGDGGAPGEESQTQHVPGFALVCADSTENDVLMKQEISTYLPSERTRHVISDQDGRVQEEHMRAVCEGMEIEGVQVLICGPVKFNQAMRELALSIGFGSVVVL